MVNIVRAAEECKVAVEMGNAMREMHIPIVPYDVRR